ncbi:MAG: glycosyltransferase [Pseudomonadota bacterium]
MKLLAISYYAPPQLTPQAIQVARLLYHLDAQVTLVHGRDPDCGDGYHQYPDFFKRVAALPVLGPGARVTGMARSAARRMLPFFETCPDRFGRWRRAALPPALAAIAAARPDAIISFGMPMSDHLLALAIKRRTGLPWLAHFSDPWADNPFHETSWAEHQVNRRLERRVVAGADGFLFTSERTRALVMGKYSGPWRAAAGVLPHAWDMRGVADPAPVGQTKVIRHIGALYGARSPEPLFKALALIVARQPRALDGIAFELVGPMAPAFLASTRLASLPPGLLTVRGQVGYLDALALARDSAALLVIDAPSDADSVFLPSKLVDYIGARRPVWAITPPGTTAELVAEWSGGVHTCADPAEPAAVARMLLAECARLPGPAPHGPDHVAQRFAPYRVAQSLAGFVHDAIARSRVGR